MKYLLIGAVALAACVLPFSLAAQTGDERAIRELQDAQAEAWNQQDSMAFADLFGDDAKMVGMLGQRWRGREEIQQGIGDALAGPFEDSEISITDVEIDMLTPLFATARVSWEMQGARVVPGAMVQPRQGVQLQVLHKQRGTWRITALQDTVCLVC
jgi:uncharacterized protein (TIGR02246 family)